VTYCPKCRKQTNECTCYICPRCGNPLNEMTTKRGPIGVCPSCRMECDLDPDDETEKEGIFHSFSNLFKEHVPVDEVKEIFWEEGKEMLRKGAIRALGGTVIETVDRRQPRDQQKKEDDDDSFSIPIEDEEKTIKCPICNVYVCVSDIENHPCFKQS